MSPARRSRRRRVSVWTWAVAVGALFVVATDPGVLGWLAGAVAVASVTAVTWRVITWRPAEPGRRAPIDHADAPAAPVAQRAEARAHRPRPAAAAAWIGPDMAAVIARAQRAEAERDRHAADAAALRAERDGLARQLAELTSGACRADAPGDLAGELRAQLARRADQVSKRIDAPGLAAALAYPRSGARPLASGGSAR